MKKSSSKRWLREHFSDSYVKRAKREGLRARSVYKLLEMQRRYRILAPEMVVVDLGAAPGGWSSYVAQLVGPKGKIFAVDRLPLEPIRGVQFVQGDFTTTAVVEQVQTMLAGRTVDLVLSDMAPNLSGVAIIDQARAISLAEATFAFAQRALQLEGTLVTKIFQGEGFAAFLQVLRHNFSKVKIFKPDASRARSSEVFLVAMEYKPKII